MFDFQQGARTCFNDDVRPKHVLKTNLTLSEKRFDIRKADNFDTFIGHNT